MSPATKFGYAKCTTRILSPSDSVRPSVATTVSSPKVGYKRFELKRLITPFSVFFETTSSEKDDKFCQSLSQAHIDASPLPLESSLLSLILMVFNHFVSIFLSSEYPSLIVTLATSSFSKSLKQFKI